MPIFTLHLPKEIAPGSQPAQECLRTVRDGFSWAAFIFTLPWLLLNRLWLWAALFLAANLLLIFAAQALGADDTALSCSALLLALFVGLEAGHLKAEGLSRRGFTQVASIVAKNRVEAELKYFSSFNTA